MQNLTRSCAVPNSAK